ncbi:MAG: nucleotidyltransferase domain-containing protein [Ignavibacteria bacterium]|nr:nucleotidyltransferase domain-containing protein [Ignavibacteria bacterium]
MNKEIKMVIDEIIKGYEPEKIILFGSNSSGEYNNYSDIDLLVIKNDKKKAFERNRLIRNLLKDFSIPVDIITKTPKEFEILKDVVGTIVFTANKYGKVVYG